jgi:hypothetical protein
VAEEDVRALGRSGDSRGIQGFEGAIARREEADEVAQSFLLCGLVTEIARDRRQVPERLRAIGCRLGVETQFPVSANGRVPIADGFLVTREREERVRARVERSAERYGHMLDCGLAVAAAAGKFGEADFSVGSGRATGFEVALEGVFGSLVAALRHLAIAQEEERLALPIRGRRGPQVRLRVLGSGR